MVEVTQADQSFDVLLLNERRKNECMLAQCAFPMGENCQCFHGALAAHAARARIEGAKAIQEAAVKKCADSMFIEQATKRIRDLDPATIAGDNK